MTSYFVKKIFQEVSKRGENKIYHFMSIQLDQRFEITFIHYDIKL